jgi:ribose transport system permease protein/putative xylitol transport system permease protein
VRLLESIYKKGLSITEVNRTLLIIVLSFIIYIINPFFYKGANLRLIIVWGSIFSLMVLGEMLYLIPAGLDLSFGGVICISNVLAAMFMKQYGFQVWQAVLIVLVLGFGIGIGTGLFGTYFSPPFRFILPVFIFTLMLSFVLTGVSRILTRAFPIYGLPDSYSLIAKATIGPVPIVVVYMVVACGIFVYFFYFKPAGWQIYATGLDDVVARKVGIDVKKVRVIACGLGSLLQAFAGVIVGSYLAVGSVLIGPPYLLPILAGAFIGGVSLAGGEGSPFGAILGGFTVYLIENIIVILAVEAFWKEVVTGSFLFLFVIFDFIHRKRGVYLA